MTSLVKGKPFQLMMMDVGVSVMAITLIGALGTKETVLILHTHTQACSHTHINKHQSALMHKCTFMYMFIMNTVNCAYQSCVENS